MLKQKSIICNWMENIMCRNKWNDLSHHTWAQQTCTKGVQDQGWQCWKGDTLEIVQEIGFWLYYQMV